MTGKPTISVYTLSVGLDYYNALLAGITDTQIKRLQSVQNAAACLSGARQRDHILQSYAGCSLHWLPMRRRIIFKTTVESLYEKMYPGVAFPDLQEFCVPVEKVQGRLRLRSASTGCVDLPRVQMSVGGAEIAGVDNAAMDKYGECCMGGYSCNVRPCNLLRQCPLLQFQSTRRWVSAVWNSLQSALRDSSLLLNTF